MRNLFPLLFMVLGLAACSEKAANSLTEEPGTQLAKEVSIFESKDNQKKWLLRADAVDFADLKSATLKNPNLLLKENGKDSASVTGKTGIFDYQTKMVTIQGDAKIKSFSEKLTISAERFFYDVDKNRIWSDVKTVITRGKTKVTAKGGVETDSKLTKIEFKKQTTQLPSDVKELQKVSL